MSPQWIQVTVFSPLFYLLTPVLLLFAIMDNSPDYIEYSAAAALAIIPVLTAVSWIALVVNRAPILIQIAQGTLTVLGLIAFPAIMGLLPRLPIPVFDYGWKTIFLVAFGSPVISIIGYRAVTRARQMTPPEPGDPIEYLER